MEDAMIGLADLARVLRSGGESVRMPSLMGMAGMNTDNDDTLLSEPPATLEALWAARDR